MCKCVNEKMIEYYIIKALTHSIINYLSLFKAPFNFSNNSSISS